LPDFLEKFTDEPERLSRASKKHGKPHTLIVAGAGLRAANLVRYVVAVYRLPLNAGSNIARGWPLLT
jgi:hypothetical protein